MEPINYSRDVLNPIEGYLQGIRFGEGINSERLGQQATQQNMGIQREAMDLQQRQYEDQVRMQQQQMAAQQAEVAAQRSRAEQGSMALMSYLEGLEAGTATPADLRRGMAAFPEMAEQFQAFASSVSEERLGNELSFGKQLAFTLANGNTDAAEGLLRTRQEAAEAAGDEQGAAVYKAQLIELAENPNGVLMQTLLPIMSNMDPEEFDTFHTDILGLGNAEAEPTAGMREYEFARSQGYKGTFEQWKSSGAPTTNVSVTTGNGEQDRYLYGTDAGVPAGWRVDRQTGEASPIPGGPVALELAQLEEKRTNTDTEGQLMMGTTLQSLNLNINAIEDNLSGDALPVTGVAGDFRRTGVGRALTGDAAFDFGNRTNQITDSAALAEIQRMRDNSPTGGAVGALTDGERVAIGNAVTALNSSTSAEEYLRAAKAYRDLSLDIAYGPGMWQLSEDGTVSAVGGQDATPSLPEDDEEFLRSLGLEP